MKKFNLLTVAILTTTILFSSLNVQAQSGNDEQPQIIIEQGAEDVPNDIIEDLIRDNPDVGVIRLINYDYIPEETYNDNYNFPSKDARILDPIGYYTTIENISTRKTVETYNQVAKDEFNFSVARGEEVTLTTKYTGSLKGSYSGEVLDSSKIGVDITVTGEYSKGTRYYGPNNDSKYNTREFRMKFYQNVGTYTQTGEICYHYYGTIYDRKDTTKTGTFKEPTKYLSYSIDKSI